MKIFDKIKAGQPVKMAFFGDSVTQGCFEGDALPEDEQYVYHTRLLNMIKEKYPHAQIEKINAGVAGNTAGMGLFRMQRDVLDKKPDLCVVCFGINDTSFCVLNPALALLPPAKELLARMEAAMDSKAFAMLKKGKAKEAYRYSMDAILSGLQKNGIETMIMLPNRMSREQMREKEDPVYFLSGINARMVNTGKMDEMMEIARTIAEKYKIPVADAYSHWKKLEEEGIVTNDTYVNGTNHPSRELHQELANVLFEAMNQ